MDVILKALVAGKIPERITHNDTKFNNVMLDTYFRIHRPGHNLDRCRTQFKLVESIEQQEERKCRIASINT